MQRLQDHEVFEITLLSWLNSERFLKSLAFGGGTMLRLCHELPRYSLDMDFWFYRVEDYEAFYDGLHHGLSEDYDITDAQNKYYSILVEIRREKKMPRLKIEIRKTQAPRGSTEEKIAFSPYSPIQVRVKGFTLQQMLKNKVVALIDRGEIRDAFDLEFLVRKGVSLDLSQEKKDQVLEKLKSFRKKDFDVKLGSVLQPELRDYYRQQRFRYLEEKLTFDAHGLMG